MKARNCALIAAAVAALVVCGLFWLNGYDFKTRGDTATACAMTALLVFGITFGMAMAIQDDMRGGK